MEHHSNQIIFLHLVFWWYFGVHHLWRQPTLSHRFSADSRPGDCDGHNMRFTSLSYSSKHLFAYLCFLKGANVIFKEAAPIRTEMLYHSTENSDLQSSNGKWINKMPSTAQHQILSIKRPRVDLLYASLTYIAGLLVCFDFCPWHIKYFPCHIFILINLLTYPRGNRFCWDNT